MNYLNHPAHKNVLYAQLPQGPKDTSSPEFFDHLCKESGKEVKEVLPSITGIFLQDLTCLPTCEKLP